jgi:Sulfotransferase domain
VSLRVVGAGLGRTGTHSLKLALETLLEGPCYHMIEIRERPDDADGWQGAAEGAAVDLTAMIDGYVAAVDWPAAAFWRQLAAENPDAIILLSTRASAEEWWRSADQTIFEVSRRMEPGPVHRMMSSIFPRTFTADYTDHDKAIAAYEAHNAAVRRDAPADRLVDWQPGDGWEPICAALGVAVPDEPFPHSNSREGFRQRRGWDAESSERA